MKIQPCTTRHSEAILAILNDAILTSTALYDYRPRTHESMERWFETKAKGDFPVLGAMDEEGTLMGFASYGPFRAFPAYKYTVEHSVYVERRFRGRKIGAALLHELIEAATAQDYHMMIGAVDASNAASVALHRSLGFALCGTVKEAGFKFGRWLDVQFYQRILSTPKAPVDG